MPRTYLTPIVLPGAPAAPEHAVRRDYVDAQVATREASGAASAAVAAHTAATDPHPQYLTATESVAAAQMPRVLNPIASGSAASSITSDASVGGSLRNVTATGAAVAVGVPTNGADRQILRYAFYAQVATTITFNASIRLSTGLSSRAFTVPQGQVLLAALEFVDLLASNKWVLTAATVSA